jgi:vacuolar iron transporter family protein
MSMQQVLEHSHTREAIHDRLMQGPRTNYLRDWIYGGIDGAVTTFAIVAGVAGADLSATIVLVLGFANLLADGFAMAASNYSGTKAEHDNYERVLGIERKHIAIAPDGEREEIRQIFEAKGFSGDVLERIVTVITSNRTLWARTMAVEEYGLSPTPRSPVLAALSTFTAFVVCGFVPLITYLSAGGLAACVIAAAATFFCVGAIKSRWSPVAWWRSALETLAIGMGAAVVAFAVGLALKEIFHVSAV